MKVSKSEMDAMQSILMTPLEDFLTDKEQAEHKDPEGLAQRRMFTKAIEAVDAVRGLRTGWVVVVRFGVTASSVTYQSFGSWSTRGQAETAATAILKAVEGTAYAVVPQLSPAGWEAMLTAADAPPAEKSVWAEIRQDAIAFRRGWNPKRSRREQHLDKV